MKKNLLNKDCFGKSCPMVVNDNNNKFEVHQNGNWFEIVSIEPWYTKDAYEFDKDGLFFWDKTPIFESKIQAVRYMVENANRLL